MWRNWSATRDDGLKLCENGAILGRILLDVLGRHKKALKKLNFIVYMPLKPYIYIYIVLIEEEALRCTSPDPKTPLSSGFPEHFLQKWIYRITESAKKKSIILTRRGGSDGACPAPFFAARWWDPRRAMIYCKNVKFCKETTRTNKNIKMWRNWSAMRDDGLKLCQNGAILGRIVLDVLGTHKKAFKN